jgi:hypothetical protein
VTLVTSLRDRIGRALFVLTTLKRKPSLSFGQVKWLARIPSSYGSLSQWQLTREGRREPVMALVRVRDVVADRAADRYALGSEALNFLDRRISELRPEAILEFGSGVSTVVLAARMAEMYGEDRPRVFSVDESETYLRETHRMLAEVGLGGCARLAHRDVREQVISGHPTACYDLDESFLRSFLELAPDVLLVDGPSGGGTVRLGTLPLVQDHLRTPCTFFLDDALREEEIAVASLWRRLAAVEISRVHILGHGLLEGRIIHPQRSS